MNITHTLAEEFRLEPRRVENILSCWTTATASRSSPVTAKELTGALDDQVLRSLNERLTYLRHLEEQREKNPRLSRGAGGAERGADGGAGPGGHPGRAGGSVPALPAQTPYPGLPGKGKRAAAAGGSPVRAACRRSGASRPGRRLCGPGKRGGDGGGGPAGRPGYRGRAGGG